MKQLKKILSLSLLIAFAITACKKTDPKLSLLDNPTAPVLNVNPSSIVLDSNLENSKDAAATFSWSAPDYGVPMATTYTLELAKHKGDLGKESDSAVVMKLSTFREEKIGTLKLNTLALKAGFEPFKSGAMYARVKCANPDNKKIPTLMSNVLEFFVTPYLKATPPPLAKLWVPGNYQGWKPSEAGSIEETAAGSGLFKGIIDFQDAGTDFNFKFTSVPDWNGTNYGLGAAANLLSTDGSAGNLTIPSADPYELSVDINGLTWSSEKYSWGLIGPAQGGWSDDTNLRYNSATKEWTITMDLVAGDFKLRLNDAWSNSYGYATLAKSAPIPTDNSAVELTNDNGQDMNIPANGNYTLTFNIADKTLKVKKN
jgi:starch-binding outer membrane protein SusE/F